MKETSFSQAAPGFLGRLILVLAVFGLSLPGHLFAAEEIYFGTVERVVDGDTIAFLTQDFERVRVRLYGIDAPEKNQSGGPESSQALKALIEGKSAEVRVLDVDRYNRLVGLIYLNGQSVNLALVADGHAWVYKRHCRSKEICREMTQAESIAKDEGRGLWAEPNPVPPWDHRRRAR
ncbi:MAG: thermonuclease family protein [Deltaproteobacteria bacterium]|jgi:endonuclease YncB( thermonuclease family)|nr:thermonuclease family protein [Deltaproteobacteria bacterium]